MTALINGCWAREIGKMVKNKIGKNKFKIMQLCHHLNRDFAVFSDGSISNTSNNNFGENCAFSLKIWEGKFG